MKWKQSDMENTDIHSYLVDANGTIKAWVIKPDKWFWLKFDDKPPRGPYETEAAVKLAAELMYDNPDESSTLTYMKLIDIFKRGD